MGALRKEVKDQRGQDEIPELTEHIDNLDDYNVIFLGFPNMEQGFEGVLCA